MKRNIATKDDICKLYFILNVINNKIYVGQTWCDIDVRFYGHKMDMRGRCIKLFNAFNSHGRENFYIVWVASCKTQEAADELESLLIDLLQTRDDEFGYNVRGGGSRGKLSQTTKNKISESKKGQIPWNTGLTHSDETKAKQRAVKLGKKATEQARENMRKAQASVVKVFTEKGLQNLIDSKTGSNNPQFGKSPSKETRQKLSEASRGEKSPMFGKNRSEESKQKQKETWIKKREAKQLESENDEFCFGK